MRKKKKGFTLVELLAVIVVLAIILVIAVPKILDVIKSSRENSLISSVKLVARNAEQKRLANEVLGEDVDFDCSEVADLSENDYQSCIINFDEEGNATVTIEGKGKFSGYTCSGTKNNVTCSNEEISSNALTVQEAIDMGLVWYDIDEDSVGIGIEEFSEYSPESHLNFSTLDIPSSIGGKRVTRIGAYAFFSSYSLESITIPNTVTSIGDSAFAYTNLISIAIPNSVITIDSNAFEGCTNLKSITISNNLTSIGYGAFLDCPNLESITIPSSVTSIGDYAFWFCEGLENVVISNSVTSIGEDAFKGTPWLDNLEYDENGLIIIGNVLYDVDDSATSVTVPNSVISIAAGAFSDCDNLASVTISNNVTSIGSIRYSDKAFAGTPWLDSLEYDENGLIIIGSVLYDVDDSVTSVTIPNNVKKIGDRAFYDCNSLESVIIPSSVTSIGDEAFAYCNNLESVTITSSVTSIGGYAFRNCTSLTSITIPNSVTSIGEGAFCDCTNLESVTISNSVTSIGYRTFADCRSLASITIPNSVTSIGDRAFDYCTRLENITNQNSVTSIMLNAFYTAPYVSDYDENGLIIIGSVLYDVDSRVTNVTIPNSIIAMNAPGWRLSSLTNVNFDGNNFRTFNNIFNETSWFDDNANEDGYILGENYLVRQVTFGYTRGN